MRGGNRVFPLITAVMFVLLLGVDYKVSGQLDLSMTVLTALIVAVELVLAFISPKLMRRQHEEAYDQTRFSGYSFDGTVRITASEISKSTPSGETVIRLADCFYVEAEDMMIFCGPNRRSIVIPARCVMAQHADSTRAAALSGVPAGRRRLLKKLVATRTKPFVLPQVETSDEEEPLLRVSVDYTEKEFSALIIDGAWKSMGQTLPMKCLLAICAAMMTSMWYAAAALPVFVLVLALLLLWPVMTARFQARRAIDATEGQALHLIVDLTPSYLRAQGKGEDGKRLTIPWTAVTRAVERPDSVEFYTGRKVIRIPKHCIDDMAELRRTADSCMEKK